MSARSAIACLLCALLLGACGGGSDDESDPPQQQRQANPNNPLALPDGVPVRSTGPGDREAIEVIRGWTDALRAGKIDQAVSYWAVPAKVQNGTPLLTLDTKDKVRVFNDALSCGAVLTAAGAGGKSGFTILAMKLTERPGGDCGTGTGKRARTAIFVRDGKIAEWYRIPDDPSAPAPRGDEQPPDVQGGPII